MKKKKVTITRGTYGSSKAKVIYFTEDDNNTSKFWFEKDVNATDLFKELKAYQDQGYSIKFEVKD